MDATSCENPSRLETKRAARAELRAALALHGQELDWLEWEKRPTARQAEKAIEWELAKVDEVLTEWGYVTHTGAPTGLQTRGEKATDVPMGWKRKTDR